VRPIKHYQISFKFLSESYGTAGLNTDTEAEAIEILTSELSEKLQGFEIVDVLESEPYSDQEEPTHELTADNVIPFPTRH